MTAPTVPASLSDATNRAILAVSEDRLAGFHREPFIAIADSSGVPADVVIERIRAMLADGVIRRVRQTLMSVNLAPGALVAWEVPEASLHAAFDFMAQEDPFSGHVVVRTAEPSTPGARYRLWTTLKVPP